MSDEKSTSKDLLAAIRSEITALIHGGHAHAKFEDAVEDFPAKFRGTVPYGLPYSAWQIVEHIRIAQHDMLTFSRNNDGTYKEMKWPEDYWPKDPEPPNDSAWEQTVKAVEADQEAFENLVNSADAEALITPFAWGSGQTLLKEALQIADHNAYHVGELIVLRRMLGIWKK